MYLDSIKILNLEIKNKMEWSRSDYCFVCKRLLGKVKFERKHHWYN